MSQENLEIVRLAYERLNAGSLDGFLELCVAEIEFRDLPALPDAGVYIGRDAVRRWWAQMLDSFEEGLRFEADQVIDAGDDRVVLANHGVGRGRGSGATVEMSFSSVLTLSEGKNAKLIVYSEHADALQAAGVQE
jgi:ketosteroid isomerase-like protein